MTPMSNWAAFMVIFKLAAAMAVAGWGVYLVWYTY